MKVLLFIVSLCLGYVTSSGYQCRGPNKITPPDDLNTVVNWPSIWNDSMPPIPFASLQTCLWQITVPDGLYATVIFYKNAPSDVSIAVTYPDGSSEGLNNNDYYPYIFTSPMASINLYKSKSEGAFSFKVQWSKYPDVSHDNINLIKGDKPIAMIPNTQLTTFTAETTVSLVGFGLKNQSDYPFLRQSAVFDGDSTNGQFLGTLYRIMMSGKEKISSGKYLTVYTWGLKSLFDYTLYMVQDRTDEQDIFTYRGVNCDSNYDCSFNIYANYGVSVLVTSDNNPEFIKSISTFPDEATLKIYEGAIRDENLVTKLTKSNYQSRLPMELKNTIRQYVLDTGVINGFQITRDSNSANWNKVYDGRKGFVHSFYHGVNSNQQDTDETFITDSKQKLYFNYVVRDADFTGDQTTLTVSVSSNGQQMSSNVFNSKNLPPITTISAQGDKYNVKYETNGVVTKGFRIDFSTTSTVYVASTSSMSPISTTSMIQQSSTSTLPKTSSISTQTSPSITTPHSNSQTTSNSEMETTTKLSTNIPLFLIIAVAVALLM
ncbi:hypothetical protein CAEBREN_16474 [Caenorhabditis brenneri]|uniref:Uncharacterized protein n=1 Tax=Caenorhabditis brenneri TaxID=135651 RepID=G0NTA6_CAEBE|nr:hypothetical protein CAEBREN_16474 [Caenorhabditis brenneri]